MVRCFSRFPASQMRSLHSASICLLLAIACSLLPTAARADLKLDLSAGFDGNYRPGAWTLLTVKVSNAPSTTSAQLQVQVRSRLSGTTTYTQTVNLHSGSATDQYTAYYLQPDSGDSPEISVQLFANGRVVADKKLEGSIPIADGQPAVLGLTQDQSGLNFLSQVDLGITHRTGSEASNPYNQNGNQPNPFPNPGSVARSRNPTRVIYPRASALPSSSFGYEAMDAVVLGDLPLDTLTEDQWSALVGWVKDGGMLIISGGADVNRARSKMLADILPLKVTGVRQARSLPSLAELYGRSPNITASPLLTGTMASDSNSICRDGGQPTLSVRHVGNGKVFLTSFDLLAPEFRAWPGQANLWQDLMQRGTRTVRITRLVKAAAQPVRFQSWMNSSSGNSRMLTDALAGIQSVEAPPFQYIGLFLLAYIIFLVPVNYLLLKRWDKKELAWITAPIIILVFSIGAYAQGYRIKGGQLYLRSCSVVEGAANTEGFAAYTVASIFSPRQDRYTLSVADLYALPEEVLEGGGFQQAAGDLVIDRGQKTSIQNALVNMWDHRNFAFQSHVSLGGSITASLEQKGGQSARVNISNGTKYALNECAISFRGSQTIIGTIHPGEAKSANIALNGNNPAGITVVSAGTPGAPAAETAIKQALAGIAGSVAIVDPVVGQNGLVGSPLVLTGWFNDDVTGLALDSDQAKTTNVNLLVVHLPTPSGYDSPVGPGTGRPLPGSGGGFNMAPPVYRPPVRAPMIAQPQNASYYNDLAYNYASRGALDLALQAANQALSLAPQDGNILDTVAEMHQRKREYRQAAQFYALAVSRQPNGGGTETHEKYGETLLALGDRANGIRHLQRAAADTRSPYGARARQALQRAGAGAAGRVGNPGGSQTF